MDCFVALLLAMTMHYKKGAIMKNNNKLSLFKTISWRCVGTLTSLVVAYFVTGNLTASLGISSFDGIAKIFLYYFHEKAWQNKTILKIMGLLKKK